MSFKIDFFLRNICLLYFVKNTGASCNGRLMSYINLETLIFLDSTNALTYTVC